jgi:hypothetical protein
VGGLSYLDGNISGARAFKASYAIESKLELDKSSGEEVRISIVEGLPLPQLLVSRECQNCSRIPKFTPASFTAF